MSERAYAVTVIPKKRSEAYSPLSSEWTLYDPKPIASALGVSIEDADKALEESGFNKAVRIREELIRWKERLRREQAEINRELEEISKKRYELKTRNNQVKENLENVRNVLRISREKE